MEVKILSVANVHLKIDFKIPSSNNISVGEFCVMGGGNYRYNAINCYKMHRYCKKAEKIGNNIERNLNKNEKYGNKNKKKLNKIAKHGNNIERNLNKNEKNGNKIERKLNKNGKYGNKNENFLNKVL